MENQENEKEFIRPFTPIDQLLLQTRSLFVNGMVNAEMSLTINRQLLALEKMDDKAPITIWINSHGGEVYSGFAIYDMIQFIKPKVITVIAGTAASMGSVIALAAEKENRLAMKNSKILLHQPLIGGMMKGPASDIEIHAKDIVQLKKRMHQLYAERCGLPVERFVELMERDRWVDPDEAIELGLISKIMSSRKELDERLQAL